MPVDKLVIPRSLWGQGSLVTKEGKMCCLGHLSLHCGISTTEMEGLNFPLFEWGNVNGWARAPRPGKLGQAAIIAASINDSYVLTSSEKEEKLIKLFADNGIALTFED